MDLCIHISRTHTLYGDGGGSCSTYTSGSIRTPAVVHLLISNTSFLCVCVYYFFPHCFILVIFILFFFLFGFPSYNCTHTAYTQWIRFFFSEPFTAGRDERSLISTSEIVYTYTVLDAMRYAVRAHTSATTTERNGTGNGRWQYYTPESRFHVRV